MQPVNLDFINIFFTIDKDNQPVVNTAGLLLDKVRHIVDRDRKNNLKGEGAKKQLAFTYFWITNTYSNYSLKSRENIIKQRIGVDDKWKLWVETKELIQELYEDKKTIMFKLLEGLEKTAHQWVNLLNLIQENNENVNEFLNKPLDKLTVEQLAQREVLLSQAASNFTDIVDMYNKLGNMITGVEKYKDRVASESKQESNKRRDSLQLNHNIYERKNIE